jgi:hypothetical protein
VDSSIHNNVRGTIVLANEPGRRLRKTPAAVNAFDVLYWSGGFSAGDSIYISFMGADGGLYVVAVGMACCDDAVLRTKIGPPLADAHKRTCNISDKTVVVREQDVTLLWPPSDRP